MGFFQALRKVVLKRLSISIACAAVRWIKPNSWVGPKLGCPNDFLVAQIILTYLSLKYFLIVNTKAACFFV